jgi:hypothetical protein
VSHLKVRRERGVCSCQVGQVFSRGDRCRVGTGALARPGRTLQRTILVGNARFSASSGFRPRAIPPASPYPRCPCGTLSSPLCCPTLFSRSQFVRSPLGATTWHSHRVGWCSLTAAREKRSQSPSLWPYWRRCSGAAAAKQLRNQLRRQPSPATSARSLRTLPSCRVPIPTAHRPLFPIPGNLGRTMTRPTTR